MSDPYHREDGDYRYEPEAVRVARLVGRRFGARALREAEARLAAAARAADWPRADLYVGVCTVLRDHQGVFSRLTRNESGTPAIPERGETLYMGRHADPALHPRRGADRGA